MERDKDGVVITRYIFIWKVKSLDSSVNKAPVLSYPLSTINQEGLSYCCPTPNLKGAII